MIGVQVYVVMHDQEMNKVLEYTSGKPKTGLFTLSEAQRVLTAAENKQKALKKMTDLDYEKYLKCAKEDDKDNSSDFHFSMPKIDPAVSQLPSPSLSIKNNQIIQEEKTPKTEQQE